MSKRKPALRIGGGFMNRSSLSTQPPEDAAVIQPAIPSEPEPKENGKMDAELANFMKQIDEVSSVPPTKKEEPERFGDWQKCVDEKTNHPYYWNVVTDEVSWVLPERILNSVEPSDSPRDSPLPNLPAQEEDSNHSIGNAVSDETNESQNPKSVSPRPTNTDEKELNEYCEVSEDLASVESPLENAVREEIFESETPPEPASKDVSTQCNFCSSSCTGGTDSTSTKMEVLKLKEMLCGKMNFLGVSTTSLINLQILLLQVETRISDWKAKVLPTSYVLKQLKEADNQLKRFEENATPDGWTSHWDSATRRYFYVNDATQEKQWNYPGSSGQDVVEDQGQDLNEDHVPPCKKTKTDDEEKQSEIPPLPPLPNTPQEKPPPPPQPDDDGYDVDELEDQKDSDDGIMMEISDDEKEEDEKQEETSKPVPVLSQQPIIYKGPENPAGQYNYNFMPKPTLQAPQTYAITQDKVSVKFKKKTSKKGTSKKSNKAMSSLVAQWQRAKTEIEQEDRKLEESDEEEKVEPSNVRIAKWKQDQISSGRALSNPNFEPVPMDWRTKLLEKKRQKS